MIKNNKNNIYKMYAVVVLALSITACGEGLLAGGASIGGSGSPKPNDNSVDVPQRTLEILFAAPVEDECHSLHRTLQFINTETKQAITEETTKTVLEKDIDDSTMRLQLTITNQSNEVIIEQWQDICLIPFVLYNNLSPKSVYPTEVCAGDVTSHEYAPMESKVFEMDYETALEQQSEWRYGEGVSYFKADKSQLDSCPVLSIDFKITSVTKEE